MPIAHLLHPIHDIAHVPSRLTFYPSAVAARPRAARFMNPKRPTSRLLIMVFFSSCEPTYIYQINPPKTKSETARAPRCFRGIIRTWKRFLHGWDDIDDQPRIGLVVWRREII